MSKRITEKIEGFSGSNQGGDFAFPKGYYKYALDYIKDGDRVLNLGSGAAFVFEKMLLKNRDVYMVSSDIVKPQGIPKGIKNFFIQDVEKPFKLDEKFDVITFFEIVEHIDKTDELLKNCYSNLKDSGVLIFSCPNLASLWGRFELLLGFEPHILEVSNEYPNFGTGIFGKKF